MNDFNKSEEEKFRDWVRKSIYEIRETVHGMALEFDKQLAELREKKKAKISKK